MKKLISIIAALAMCATAAVSASATTIDQTSTENASTTLSFDYKYDPTYTVTIPSEVELTKEGTPVEITAENVNYLDGKKVSVTIAGTSYVHNQMILLGRNADGTPNSAWVKYEFIKPDGTVITTEGKTDAANGVEVASFTENGTETFTAKPILNPPTAQLKKGVYYSGSVKFAVELADIA